MLRIHSFHRWALFLFLFLVSIVSFRQVAYAQTPTEHYTLLINQVRGNECCSAGGLNELQQQVTTLQELQLPATFTVRYDALLDPRYVNLLQQARQSGAEIGGFLEITPQLASASGVTYTGTEENWYEAQHVYLVGYGPEDRQKLIDTYMNAFQQAFGTYPHTTTAWIIDTPSLQYLHDTYGVTVHQITREQWGTDSYTMWGGPPHLPYFPSEEWAFVPSASASGHMPIIVRQTISDPVWNYGDTTNSYTSQPNDYALKNRGFDYFVHLFNQAHQQDMQPYTFALLGLENSMPEIHQDEYTRQLQYVTEWTKSSENSVLTASEFAKYMTATSPDLLTVLHGTDAENGNTNQAWWITTPKYRARLRYNNQTLYLTDLRLYDPQLQDPYTTRVAQKLAYWVIPFSLDGARFWQNDLPSTFHLPHSDQLTPRKEDFDQPSRITIATKISPEEIQLVAVNDTTWAVGKNDQPLITFTPNHIATYQPITEYLQPLEDILTGWQWTDTNGTFDWGFTPTRTDSATQWFPFIHPASLEQERENRYPYLLPEIKERPLDLNKTYVQVTNAFAQAGRNPIRLAFFPRDNYGYPTYITEEPTITTNSESVNIELTTPSSQNGLVFIDLTSGEIQKVTVQVQFQDYLSTHQVVFAPNCKQEWQLCLQHPQYWWWYFRNWSGDKYRQWLEKRQ